MKKIILLLATTTLLFSNANKDLLEYQENYTLCKGTTNYEIADCFLNTVVDYSKIRADNFVHIDINKDELLKAEEDGEEYNYVMSILPQNKRYIELEGYLTFLYSIKDNYTSTNFKKFEDFNTSSENILATKKIFNLTQNSKLNETPLFDEEMKKELTTYQLRYGFEPNGKLWKETRTELNKSFDSIVLKVKKNLEIERSLNDKDGTYVYINIPEFRMYYFKENELKLDMNVVIGKNHHRTPIFTEDLKWIVKNPKWNVPASIYNNEYSHWSDEKIEEKGFAFNSDGKFYQKPGTRNALGIVKFLFPNTYNVYMHDTPSKSLFAKRVRAFSHGCIRLEKPIELLNVLGHEYDSEKTRWLEMKKTFPVHVEYHTVWVDLNGVAQFRNDIYGYEKALF